MSAKITKKLLKGVETLIETKAQQPSGSGGKNKGKKMAVVVAQSQKITRKKRGKKQMSLMGACMARRQWYFV